VLGHGFDEHLGIAVVVWVTVGDDYAIEVKWTQAVLVREEERSWAWVNVYLCLVVYSKSTCAENLVDGHVPSATTPQKYEFYHTATAGKIGCLK
jgi:hypothetical protein